VATVRIDDGAGNRFGRAMAEALRKAALSLQDAPPTAVVMVGAPDFSKGLADATDPLFEPFVQLIQNRDAFRAQEIVQRYRNALAGFARLPCAVIAAIEGECNGPMMGLALSADIRVASLDSTFEPTPLSRGMIPGMGELTQLAARASVDRIASTVLTGGTWDAPEALSLGLVSQLVAPGSAADTATALVDAYLAQPDAARLQALVTLRAMASDPAGADDAEAQGGARTWIRGEWRR
jgi:enoyl-CoA hydratase/carnithine racemase